MFAETVPIKSIVVPAERLRKVNPTAVEVLADNIKERGLIYPLVVRRETGNKSYRLIAGEHRLEAAKSLGWSEIAAIVRIADDTRMAQLEDEIEEIDENVVREEMQPGEVKLATKRRRKLFIELEALRREEKAKLEYDEALIAEAKSRKEKDRLRKRKEKAEKALGAADPTHNRSSVKGPQVVAVNKAAAGEFNRETAKKHGITEEAVRKRVREADYIEQVAEWAKVDARDLARSCIQSEQHMRAALEIIEKYGRDMVIEAGNVHVLLKRHVRDAAKGHDDVNIVKFKSKVDAAIRRETADEQRSKEVEEQCRHAASVLSKAAKAVLDAQDVLTGYKLSSKYIDRLDRMKAALRTMAQEIKAA